MGTQRGNKKTVEVSKKGKIDVYRLEALLDQWEEITCPDTESEDYSFIHGKKGVELNHIKSSIKEDYRIYKCVLSGRNANFNQFKPRGTDMTNLREVALINYFHLSV